MTEPQLKARVRFWQNKLALLGLSIWRFDICVIDGTPTGVKGPAAAAIDRMDHYDSASIEFVREEIAELTASEIDQVIVHELLHAAFRDFEEAIHLVDGVLPATAWTIWDNALDHELEALIERLARTLVAFSEK